MLKAKKFTAHAPRHVTCKQWVKNDHIFGFPVAILPIHYATFMGLRWVYQGRRLHVPRLFGLGDIITNVPLNISGVISAIFTLRALRS